MSPSSSLPACRLIIPSSWCSTRAAVNARVLPSTGEGKDSARALAASASTSALLSAMRRPDTRGSPCRLSSTPAWLLPSPRCRSAEPPAPGGSSACCSKVRTAGGLGSRALASSGALTAHAPIRTSAHSAARACFLAMCIVLPPPPPLSGQGHRPAAHRAREPRRSRLPQPAAPGTSFGSSRHRHVPRD